ncbi:hypothetical protein [Deinococcus sedimenti]|nr:hypothetical protein [Deinococcus sedimenti]
MLTSVLLGAALLIAGCGAAPAPVQVPVPGPPSAGQATPVPVLPPTDPTPPASPIPVGPTLHVLDDSLLRVTLDDDALVIVGTDPGGTTFVRLTGCPGPCRLTGPAGVLLPVAGLRVRVLDGLTVQARAPLGDWTDAARYD